MVEDCSYWLHERLLIAGIVIGIIVGLCIGAIYHKNEVERIAYDAYCEALFSRAITGTDTLSVIQRDKNCLEGWIDSTTARDTPSPGERP